MLAFMLKDKFTILEKQHITERLFLFNRTALTAKRQPVQKLSVFVNNLYSNKLTYV